MAQLLIANSTRGSVEKGDIWEVRANDTIFGGEEPNLYVLLKIPDKLMTELDSFVSDWSVDLDYSVVNSNLSIDGHRIKVWNKNTNSTLGDLTRNNVENYLSGWGAVVFSAAKNEVVFDCSINGIVESESFWEVNIGGVVFNEISYDQGTGVHRISVDYNAIGNNPSYIERYVADKADTIVSHDNKIIVFDVSRNNILNVLKDGVKEKLKLTIKRRRYKLKNATVDFIIGQGGVYIDTYANLLTNLTDKFTE